MSESKDYKKFKENVIRPTDRIDRIENVIVTGMLDVNLCIEGSESWVELKSPKEPARATTPLFGSNHKLSQEQKNWLLRQRNAKGKGWVLVCTDRNWFLVASEFADGLNEMTVPEIREASTWCASKPIRKEQWKQLREVLSKK